MISLFLPYLPFLFLLLSSGSVLNKSIAAFHCQQVEYDKDFTFDHIDLVESVVVFRIGIVADVVFSIIVAEKSIGSHIIWSIDIESARMESNILIVYASG